MLLYLALFLAAWNGFLTHALIDDKVFRPTASELHDPRVYPQRSVYGIKSIQPDDWNVDELVGNGAGGVAVNYPWGSFQPNEKQAPCAANEITYEGYCFIPALRDLTLLYTNQQLMITGILIMPPQWARRHNTDCKQPNQDFCAPDEGGPFGRFAGFLASYFNGRNGNGRISEFVIMNEVNAAEWYNVGCGNGKRCDLNKWVHSYGQVYNAAYDHIRRHQPEAPVLISFEHNFGSQLDIYLSNASPVVSAETFLRTLVPQLEHRQWSLAFHAYAPDLLRAEFSRNDWPKVTFGNINRLVGWLMQNYPYTPSAHKVYLTENGINSISPYSDQNKQHDQLCAAFQIVLATPNVDLFIYHRMKDHPVETKDGLGLGLVDTNNNFKRAWSLWALCNRFDTSPSQLSCGFELLPYVQLKRAMHPTRGHLSTTRPLPDGYKLERTWSLFREQQDNTKLIFECARSGDQRNFPSIHWNCENQDAWGPLGYVYVNQSANPRAVAIYRCRTGSDYFISPDAKCENTLNEGLLGYALP